VSAGRLAFGICSGAVILFAPLVGFSCLCLLSQRTFFFVLAVCRTDFSRGEKRKKLMLSDGSRSETICFLGEAL
jgi:hypothetical protein